MPAVRRVDHIVLGRLVIPAWYESPFPAELNADLQANGGRLYVCEVCLKYTTRADVFAQHAQAPTCGCGTAGHPPGHEIYASNGWSVWDVDGDSPSAGLMQAMDEVPQCAVALEGAFSCARYCHAATLVARLFLSSKVNRYGTAPFRFFILTEVVGQRHCFRGMFSREKDHTRNNLSCIVVLPPWQRSGWGKRLVHLSYLLTRTEGTCGTPEGPLSQLGQRVYETYFDGQVLDFLRENVSELRQCSEAKVLEAVANGTGIDTHSAKQALERLSEATGAAGLDWDALSNPRLNASSSRPELELNAAALFHMSYEELTREPTLDI
eukprot:TRINITY_DN17156_c0_g2_i2.p1 TRINITY_DN17156_c0_g2~~TRINITY_DN17156_c0_g2_i2.p1  ORF type:complete len:323 (+),score=82.14 TRINITY_DN17156_c0_g2_i2:259-1227(+)